MTNQQVELDKLFDQLEYQVHEETDKMIDQHADELKKEFESEEGGMLTPDQRLERFRITMHENVKVMRDAWVHINRGMDAVINNAERFLSKDQIVYCAKTLAKFQNEEPATIDPNVFKEKTMQEVLGLPEKVLQCFYVIGYKLFYEGKVQDASDIFFMLTSMNGLEKDYWMAFAMAEKALGNNESAIQAFIMASLFDTHDPLAHMGAADCYIALKDPDHAMEELNEAKEANKECPEAAKYQPHITSLESTINHLRHAV